MKHKLEIILPYIIGFYIVSLFVSMAGMEIFGWLTALCGFTLLPSFLKNINKTLMITWGLLGLLFVTNIISSLGHDYSRETMIEIIGRMRWSVFVILITPAIVQIKLMSLFKIFKFVLLLSVVISLYAIFQHFTGIDIIRVKGRALNEFSERVTAWPIYRSVGFLSAPLTFGYSFGLFVATLLGYLLTSSVRRLELILVFILGSLALYTTLSRGVWIAYVMCSFCAFWILLKPKVAAMITAVFVSPILVLFITSKTFFSRIMELFQSNAISVNDRFYLWRANWEMFKEFPFFGVGYGQNETLTLKYYDKIGIVSKFGGHAHNTFLQFLSGMGGVGFIMFLVVTILFLIQNYRLINVQWKDGRLKSLFAGFLVAQIFLIFGGLTECNFKDAEVNHVVMVIWALILGYGTLFSLNKRGLS